MGRIAKIKQPEKKKSKRKAPIPGNYENIGGHMIAPPKECKYKRRNADGAIWVDLCICFSICEEQCETYKEFIKMDKQGRIKYLKRNGVFYPWKG